VRTCFRHVVSGEPDTHEDDTVSAALMSLATGGKELLFTLYQPASSKGRRAHVPYVFFACMRPLALNVQLAAYRRRQPACLPVISSRAVRLRARSKLTSATKGFPQYIAYRPRFPSAVTREGGLNAASLALRGPERHAP
jgi:hypothetical protein